MSSPTQKTLALIRSQDYDPWIVEKFNAYSGRRTDLFYIIDIIYLTRKTVVGVQSCGMAFSAHRKKIMEDEADYTKHWLRTKGNRLILIGWRKLKVKRGGIRMVYKPRIAFITLKKKKLKFKEVQTECLK